MLTWNVPAIFTMLGDTQGVIAHCARYAPDAAPPNMLTVAMWKHRGRISYEWCPVVVAGLLHRLGVGGPEYAAMFVAAQPQRAKTPTLEELGL